MASRIKHSTLEALANRASLEARVEPKELRRFYHGSPEDIDQFEPRPHALSGGEGVVFGTPNRAQAIASLQQWSDDDFDQGYYNDEPMYMREKYPGAFEKIYGGKGGYLYSLDPSSFESQDNLMPTEAISKESPKILKKEYIEDALRALQESGATLIPYEKTSGEDASRTAVIIKGNPDAPVLNADVNRDAYYKRLEELLSGEGYDVRLDPGLPNTTPAPADVWLGHSRGADRLRFAPEGTRTIALGSPVPGALNHPDEAAFMDRISQIDNFSKIPLSERPVAPEGHYLLTEDLENSLRERLSDFGKTAVIHEQNGKYVLKSKDGKKTLGTHETKEKALAQERAIQASKHGRRKTSAPKKNKNDPLEKMKKSLKKGRSLGKSDKAKKKGFSRLMAAIKKKEPTEKDKPSP